MSYPLPIQMPPETQKLKTEYQREQDIFIAQLEQLKRDRRARFWRWLRHLGVSPKRKAAPKDRFEFDKRGEGLSLHKAEL